MTCLIRQADTEDLPLLPQIERAAAQLFLSIPSLAFVADGPVMSLRDHIAMQKTGVIFVAQSLEGQDAGDVVGFVCGQHIAKTLHVYEMSVVPNRQGQGIGSALMAAILDDALTLKCHQATLTTFRDVAWNENFYRKLGFSRMDDADLDARLQANLQDEAAKGLPADKRCAMLLKFV